VDAGLLASFSAGLRGRATNSPPQLGQTKPSSISAHVLQKVHSKEQINASGASGGRSVLQHSQPGRSSSMSISFLNGLSNIPSLSVSQTEEMDRLERNAAELRIVVTNRLS